MPFPVPSVEGIQAALSLPKTPAHVGTGGFKAVYRAETTSGPEAIKAVYVPPAGGEDEDAMRDQLIARAEREIDALGRCESPCLVRLGSLSPQMHSIEAHDYLIYSEEFLPGESLNGWIDRDPRPSYDQLLLVFRSLIDLIRALSGSGFVHRDIKPDNVMNTGLKERPYVVLDLGIAFKMLGTELTQGGVPPRTLLYTAPELLKPNYKDAMDFRCDLYAAGLTVYVLATGHHPFAQDPEHEYATAYRIMVQRPRPLVELRPDLPPIFCAIVDRCIRKRQALRYAGIDLVEEALQEVM